MGVKLECVRKVEIDGEKKGVVFILEMHFWIIFSSPTHLQYNTLFGPTMPKRSADSTEARKRRKLADEVLEAARNGDTAAVRAVLKKLPPDSKTVTFDAVHEACRGNHDECLALLLPYVENADGLWSLAE